MINAALLKAHIFDYLADSSTLPGPWQRFFRSTEIWDGDRDRSLLESFGHLQLGAAAALLLVVAARSPGHQVLRVWGGVFFIMAADDFLMLHERVGHLVRSAYPEIPLTAPATQELGGLGFWAVLASGLGLALWAAHLRSCRDARRASRAFALALTPLAFVAAGYVLVAAAWPPGLEGMLGLAVVVIRMSVKLMTMTGILVLTMRLRGNGRLDADRHGPSARSLTSDAGDIDGDGAAA